MFLCSNDAMIPICFIFLGFIALKWAWSLRPLTTKHVAMHIKVVLLQTDKIMSLFVFNPNYNPGAIWLLSDYIAFCFSDRLDLLRDISEKYLMIFHTSVCVVKFVANKLILVRRYMQRSLISAQDCSLLLLLTTTSSNQHCLGTLLYTVEPFCSL